MSNKYKSNEWVIEIENKLNNYFKSKSELFDFYAVYVKDTPYISITYKLNVFFNQEDLYWNSVNLSWDEFESDNILRLVKKEVECQLYYLTRDCKEWLKLIEESGVELNGNMDI